MIMTEKLRRMALFDWFVILCALFLLSGAALKFMFPGYLKKVVWDNSAPYYAEITVALDSRYEWLRDRIGKGDNLRDTLEGKVWAEILGKEQVSNGPLKGRTLVRLKVFVMRGDSGPTVYARYKIRMGERFVFECPLYVFESVIVGWKGVA